jgi:hypothetical protein
MTTPNQKPEAGVSESVRITRAWAMPNKHTFKIAPIAELLDRYVLNQGANWMDPFCGHSLRAQFRNDLDPKNAFATTHLEATEYLRKCKGNKELQLDGCLFDPPYSPGQIARVYKSVGLAVAMKDTQNAALYSECRDLIAPLIKPGGYVISFGWNSTGMGKKHGFEKVEMLIVNHGGAHNDTIVLVESKPKEHK